jgi:phospholipase C
MPSRPLRHALLATALAAIYAPAAPAATGPAITTTPIEHVIVVIGENRTFDHLFATYVPRPGETVDNLLSRRVIMADGTPGPNFAAARQYSADNRTVYRLSPDDRTPYQTIPPAMTEDAAPEPSDTAGPPLKSLLLVRQIAVGLPKDAYHLALTGATGLPKRSVDIRINGGRPLPNGPFPLTPALPYDAFAGGPVHRFYQMWQQMDCDAADATPVNPSGCRGDLYPWIETVVGPGSDGKPQPSPFDDTTTGEGSNAMGFYNVGRGDAPYLKALADHYALADNYHQAVLGGTGANHIALGTGDAIWYSDGAGHPATPPAQQIEDPDPQSGTNNFYKQDGYNGGSYSACADHGQPGVGAVLDYLANLASHPDPRCEPGHYYLLNNYEPGYLGDGTVNKTADNVVPPSTVRTIGDALTEKRVTWRYYGENWDLYLKDPKNPLYCTICNPFQYSSQVMTDAAARNDHLKDVVDLYQDLAHHRLPAVSFVKPSALNDGHPASSKLTLFEAFSRKLIDAVRRDPHLWKHTAILITFDEGGGYYDGGYVQPVDFFGDGPRIPLLVVSPYSRGGHVVHTYYDHVSIAKFIERNWGLAPITARSRDNLPNPSPSTASPYVPGNSPAIGDLMEMFRF